DAAPRARIHPWRASCHPAPPTRIRAPRRRARGARSDRLLSDCAISRDASVRVRSPRTTRCRDRRSRSERRAAHSPRGELERARDHASVLLLHYALRKRDELVVPWNTLEASLAPANLGFLEDLARARHEVPPDQALAVRFFPADQHQAGARQRLYFHGLAIRQDRHMLRRKRRSGHGHV